MDVRSAKASVEKDRDRILAAIQSDVGDLNVMTHRLKDALVAGAVAQVPPAESEWTEDVGRELHIAARLSQLYGRLAEAEPLYRRDLEGRQRVLGADHPYTLGSVSCLAGLFQAQGKLAEAEPLYRRALEGSERVLGADHPDKQSHRSATWLACS